MPVSNYKSICQEESREGTSRANGVRADEDRFCRPISTRLPVGRRVSRLSDARLCPFAVACFSCANHRWTDGRQPDSRSGLYLRCDRTAESCEGIWFDRRCLQPWIPCRSGSCRIPFAIQQSISDFCSGGTVL